MKIMVIGGTGLIGSAVTKELGSRHEVIVVGHSSGTLHVDITDPDSILALFKKVGQLDAVVITTGIVVFAPLPFLTRQDFLSSMNSKLLGQVQCVLTGIDYLADAGSFTLTSGILNRDPIPLGSVAAMVNGGIDGFVAGAALELPRGIRINAVSPTVVTEALDSYGPFFRGFESVPVEQVARMYSKAVEGLQTGRIYCSF